MRTRTKKWVTLTLALVVAGIGIFPDSGSVSARPLVLAGPAFQEPFQVKAASVGFSGFGFSQPARRLKETLQRVVEIITDENLRWDRKARRQALMLEIGQRFSSREMARRTLAAYWQDMSVPEQDRFVVLFKGLLEKSYVHLVEANKNGSVHYLSETIEGRYATVSTEISNGDQTVSVQYKLVQEGNDWLVYDFLVQGVSMVRHNRAEFSRIIRQQSLRGLYRLLRDQTT